jgi:hypothetical protein
MRVLLLLRCWEPVVGQLDVRLSEEIETGVAGSAYLLEAPQVSKMFFISPPPSPPHGWVMRNEDPPNKDPGVDVSV